MSTKPWKMATGFETPDEANAELMRLRAELASEREARKAAEQREAENRDAYDRKNDELQDALARAEEAESELAVERSCKYDAELARDKATARAEQAERERDEARRIHAANVEAGAALAAEFDRAGVGAPRDGVFTRARALLAAREQAEREREALREAFRGEAPDTYKAVASALVECLDDGPRMAMAKHARRMETRALEANAARERAEYAVSLLGKELEEERRTVAELREALHKSEDHSKSLLRDAVAPDGGWWSARATRAEADNAALVNEMSTALEHVSARRYGDAGEGLLAALNTAHPGAALLEEREKMRAHEAEMAASLRTALADLAKLEEYACNTCAPDEYATPEARKVAQALERLRALERAGVRQFVAPALSRVTVVMPVRPGRTEKDMSRKEELKVLSKNFGGCGCKDQCEREQGGEGEEWMGRKPNGRYAVCETEAEKLGVKIPKKTRAR